MRIPDNLKRLLNFPSSEKININIKGKYYEVNKMFAISLSPRFYEILFVQPTINSISLNIEDNKDDFKKFLKGEDIEENFYLKLTLLLKNKELLEEWKTNKGKINKINVKERMNKLIEAGSDIEFLKEEIEYIGEHFEEIKDEIDIDNIGSEYLIEIMKNTKKIEKEEKIWAIIKRRIEKEEDIKYRRELFKCIHIEGLEEETFIEMLKIMNKEDISDEIWSKIKNLLIKVQDSTKSDKTSSNYHYF